MPVYSDAEKATIVARADAGVPWEDIGREIGRSATAVEYAARRMRRRGEWPANPDSVRELPAGGPGRPRNRQRTAAVSVRFAPDVDAALRDVAVAAGFGRRVGKVLTEAIARAVRRAQRKRVNDTPLDLDPGKPVALEDGDKVVTMSVCVDADVFDQLVALADVPPTTAVHDAAVQLLQDLNYRIGEA